MESSLAQSCLGFNVLHCLGLDFLYTKSVTILSFKVEVAFKEELHLFGREVDVDHSLKYLSERDNENTNN